MRKSLTVLALALATQVSAQTPTPLLPRAPRQHFAALDQPMFANLRTDVHPMRCCGSTLTKEQEARLTSMLEFAEMMFKSGQPVTARQYLREVVQRQKDGNAYPGAALRRLANVEYALGNQLAAVNALEELMASAARYGDVDARVGALVDATLLYDELGRSDRHAELVRQLQPLLSSPEVPVATNRQVAMMLRLK